MDGWGKELLLFHRHIFTEPAPFARYIDGYFSSSQVMGLHVSYISTATRDSLGNKCSVARPSAIRTIYTGPFETLILFLPS
jgi:hypothetical protein